ncbi:MAG: dephospho-CoA kinase [Pseudomonadota bacterium]
MIILGLTGSIGMGKSTTAKMFANNGAPVYDADAAVHRLYEKGGAAVEPLSHAFEGIVVDGAIDRNALREQVVDNFEAMSQLEKIVHPLVGMSQIAFREEAAASGAPFAVLDIPLLFETGGDRRCDYVCIVTAPPDVQRTRVLARPDMTADAFEAILAKQTPDSEKRAKADFIVSSAFGLDFAMAQVSAISDLLSRIGRESNG